MHTDNIATNLRENENCHWFKKLIQNIKVLSIQIYRWYKNKDGENYTNVINVSRYEPFIKKENEVKKYKRDMEKCNKKTVTQ